MNFSKNGVLSNSTNDIDVKILQVLERYLSNLDIHDDVGGCTIIPYRIEFRDDRWEKINDAIKKLDGSWVKATKFTRGYWRIPKRNNKYTTVY